MRKEPESASVLNSSTLSYNLYILTQILELRYSPSSATKTNENAEKDARKKCDQRSKDDRKKSLTEQKRKKTMKIERVQGKAR